MVNDSNNFTAADTRRSLIVPGWMRILACLAAYVALFITLRTLLAAPLVLLSVRLNKFFGLGITAWHGILRAAFTAHFPMIVSVAFFLRFVDRRTFSSLGFDTEALLKKFGLGMVTATVAVSVVFVISLQSDLIAVHRTAGFKFLGSAGMSLLQQLLLAFAEELLMLGYVVTNLREHLRTHTAALVSASIFAAAHSLNLHLSAAGAVNLFLLGLLMALYYVRTNDLIAPIAWHWMWNFVQGPVLGYNVSGLSMNRIFRHETKGPDLLTGGLFGLEGSVVTTAVLLLAIALVAAAFKPKSNFVAA